jgi:NADH:ubiquinone oxidoreductase subunit F (NADH-binding)
MTTAVLDPTRRLLTAAAVDGSAPDLAAHHAAYGVLAPPRGDDPEWRARLWRAVTESGLAGRGGAGFPAGLKWDAVRDGRRRPTVVVNAMEGEPASAKDRVLLTRSPHLVLDGASVAAAVVGASEVVVCIPDDAPATARAVERAVAERERSGHGGVRTSVVRPPGRYVSGEESALASWMESGRALPVLRIDKSVPLSVGRRPVLVHNAETLSQVALIARYGPAWFRQVGTPEAPGTTLVTVTGAVGAPGVLEVELGTPVVDILGRAGLPGRLGGALLGGYGGSWLAPERLATPFAPGPLAEAGATLGVGIIVALPEDSCGIAETARVARYMAGQSAGQCGPCVFGLPALADDLERLAGGRSDPDLLARMGRRAGQIEGRGACRHPDGVVRLVRSALAVFADDVRSHAGGNPCPGHAAPTVMTLPAPAFGAGGDGRTR